MRRGNIKGALVGVEAVTPEGLKDVYKSFNDVGDALVTRLRTFKDHGVHVLGSFIFGLPSDRPSTFEATAEIAERAGVTLAQFVMLTPYPGTIDFQAWEKSLGEDATRIAGIPVTRHWLIPQENRPKVYTPHPVMTPGRNPHAGRRRVWDRFYSLSRIWERSRVTPTLRSRLAFILVSKLYRQMYANTASPPTARASIGRIVGRASSPVRPVSSSCRGPCRSSRGRRRDRWRRCSRRRQTPDRGAAARAWLA